MSVSPKTLRAARKLWAAHYADRRIMPRHFTNALWRKRVTVRDAA
jgi:hypothetical protein